MPIPDFIDKYHLPPGEYESSLTEVETHFAQSTAMRKKVWTSFMMLYKRLEQLDITPNIILIDGSFVTGRDEPEDVDCAALFDIRKVQKALSSANQHDHDAILMFMNSTCQLPIRNLFGAHLLVAYDDATLSGWSLLFRKGTNGQGLRNPDPSRDPSWVVKPSEKGIIKVDLNKIV